MSSAAVRRAQHARRAQKWEEHGHAAHASMGRSWFHCRSHAPKTHVPRRLGRNLSLIVLDRENNRRELRTRPRAMLNRHLERRMFFVQA